MEALKYGGFAATVLLIVAYFLRRAKSDAVIAQLSRPDRTEEIKEITRLEEEVKNAKISYRNSRDEYERTKRESTDDVQR